jgi:NarL family two-component system response regulator LiaR
LEQPSPATEEWPDDLTDREVDIMRLVAKGYSNVQIAADLSLSDRTVSTHVSRILAKLKLENRTQIALYALRKGLANLDDE